jgi:transposase
VGAARKKKRKLHELTEKEKEAIVGAHLKDDEQQTEIAARFGVHPQLVNRLVNDHRKRPLVVMKRQLKQQRKQLEIEAVSLATSSMIRRGVIVESAAQIVKETEAELTVPVTNTRVKTVLKRKLGMSYRRTRTAPPQANTHRCLVLRQ